MQCRRVGCTGTDTSQVVSHFLGAVGSSVPLLQVCLGGAVRTRVAFLSLLVVHPVALCRQKTSGFPQALTESHQSGRVSTLAVVACPPSEAFKIIVMFVCKAWLGPEAVGNSSQPGTGNTAMCWGGDKNSIR